MSVSDEFLFLNALDEDSIVLKEWNKSRNPIYWAALIAFVIILLKAVTK